MSSSHHTSTQQHVPFSAVVMPFCFKRAAIAAKTCLNKKINLLEDDIYFPLFIFVRQLTTAAAPGSSCCSLNPNRQQHFSNNIVLFSSTIYTKHVTILQ